jgi:hypothetical protein
VPVAEAARFIIDRGVLAEGGPVLVRLIAQIASRFGVVVTQKLAAQAVPVIGAIGGAASPCAGSNGATTKTPPAWPMTSFQPPPHRAVSIRYSFTTGGGFHLPVRASMLGA